jgi:hypothetical protein
VRRAFKKIFICNNHCQDLPPGQSDVFFCDLEPSHPLDNEARALSMKFVLRRRVEADQRREEGVGAGGASREA